MFERNVGGIDRVLRIVVGAVLLSWVLFANGPAWAWVGVLPLATGLLGRCGLYSMLGIRTCGVGR